MNPVRIDDRRENAACSDEHVTNRPRSQRGQPEHGEERKKSAMQIGPQDCQRDQEPDAMRRFPQIGLDHPHGDRKQDHRKHVRSREKMNRGRADSQERDHDRDKHVRSAPDHAPQQDGRGEHDQNARQQNDAFQPGRPIQRSVNHVGEPFPGEPGRARLRERIKIVMRHRVMIEDPFAGADMPTGVRIGQQPLPSVGSGQEEPHDQRQEIEIRNGRNERLGSRGFRNFRDPGDRLRRSHSIQGIGGMRVGTLRPVAGARGSERRAIATRHASPTL